MKRFILAAATALALAAAAVAAPDPGAGVTYGNNAVQPQPGFDAGYPPDLGAPLWRNGVKSVIPMRARNDVGLHCPADKVKLCDAATTELSAYRCLIFHRSKLSTPCQHAVDELTPASKGAL
jgi:hypothetical protein